LSTIFATVTLIVTTVVEDADDEAMNQILFKNVYYMVLIPFSLALDVKLI
jgi:hypothetical protein